MGVEKARSRKDLILEEESNYIAETTKVKRTGRREEEGGKEGKVGNAEGWRGKGVTRGNKVEQRLAQKVI